MEDYGIALLMLTHLLASMIFGVAAVVVDKAACAEFGASIAAYCVMSSLYTARMYLYVAAGEERQTVYRRLMKSNRDTYVDAQNAV